MNPQDSAAAPADIEIVTTRVFAASRETVFDAFADPSALARWWGPHGFRSTFHAFEPRPGGAWRLTMHGPDGANYENAWQFLEFARPERIAVRHLQPGHDFVTVMTYADAGAGETRLTWRMTLERSAENERLQEFMAAANEQNFDRLAAQLRARHD
jgi:uncharacterized protein YndB with AHSA1/START domain